MRLATRNQLLARLHCIKKEHGWDEDTYRDILQLRTGQRSAKDLSGSELARLIASLRGNPEWGFIDAAAPEKQPLLRKICALCRAMKVGKEYAEGVAKRQHGVPRRLEMMDYGELYQVAGALVRTQKYAKKGAA